VTHPGMAAIYAAMYGGRDSNASIYPTTVSSSTEQAQQSNYYGQRYGDIQTGAVNGLSAEDLPCYRDYNDDRGSMISVIVQYVMAVMEPTDRCLRMPGDIYPADGTRPEVRSVKHAVVPGNDPWDGESDVPPSLER
jgi:hypothetical protein